jgi:hypothetical protein
MEEWHQVNSENDIRELMNSAAEFHDATLNDVDVVVRSDPTGTLGNLSVVLRLTQLRVGRRVDYELLFTGVVGFYMAGLPQDYAAGILSALLLRIDGLICWADDDLWQPDAPVSWRQTLQAPETATSWVVARSMQWRILDGASARDSEPTVRGDLSGRR